MAQEERPLDQDYDTLPMIASKGSDWSLDNVKNEYWIRV